MTRRACAAADLVGRAESFCSVYLVGEAARRSLRGYRTQHTLRTEVGVPAVPQHRVRSVLGRAQSPAQLRALGGAASPRRWFLNSSVQATPKPCDSRGRGGNACAGRAARL